MTTTQSMQEKLAELELYKKKARYVMAKLHKEIEDLESINADLQAKLLAAETRLKVRAKMS